MTSFLLKMMPVKCYYAGLFSSAKYFVSVKEFGPVYICVATCLTMSKCKLHTACLVTVSYYQAKSIPQLHCPTFSWKNEIRFRSFWYGLTNAYITVLLLFYMATIA